MEALGRGIQYLDMGKPTPHDFIIGPHQHVELNKVHGG